MPSYHLYYSKDVNFVNGLFKVSKAKISCTMYQLCFYQSYKDWTNWAISWNFKFIFSEYLHDSLSTCSLQSCAIRIAHCMLLLFSRDSKVMTLVCCLFLFDFWVSLSVNNLFKYFVVILLEYALTECRSINIRHMEAYIPPAHVISQQQYNIRSGPWNH